MRPKASVGKLPLYQPDPPRTTSTWWLGLTRAQFTAALRDRHAAKTSPHYLDQDAANYHLRFDR